MGYYSSKKNRTGETADYGKLYGDLTTKFNNMAAGIRNSYANAGNQMVEGAGQRADQATNNYLAGGGYRMGGAGTLLSGVIGNQAVQPAREGAAQLRAEGETKAAGMEVTLAELLSRLRDSVAAREHEERMLNKRARIERHQMGYAYRLRRQGERERTLGTFSDYDNLSRGLRNGFGSYGGDNVQRRLSLYGLIDRGFV